MADTPKILYQGQPGTSTASIYTVPASTNTIVLNINCINASTSAAAIEFFVGGTAAANRLTALVTLQPNESLIFDGKLTLETAKVLYARASVATSITVTISGMELGV